MAKLKKITEQDSEKGIQSVLDGEYDIPGLAFDAPVILDIGANIGAFSVWAAERFPNATIFAYEPNPQTFSDLEENVAGLDVSLRRVAVADFDGKAPLFLGKNNRGECSLVDVGEQRTDQAGKVRVVSADKLPAAEMIKLDVEGMELRILAAYPHLKTTKVIVLEWHGQENRAKVRALLSANGFQAIEDRETMPERGIQKFVRPHYPRLFIGILAGGGKSWTEFKRCLEELKELAPKQGVELAIVEDSGTGVDRSRNRLYALARKQDGITHFMFLDDDIVFKPEWVIGMVKSDLDVVGGAYPRKQINWEMVHAAALRGVPASELGEHSTDWIINHPGEDGWHCHGIGDFMPVEEVGTGFLMFKMSVGEEIIKRWGRDMEYVTDYPPRDEIHHMLFACQRDPRCKRDAALSALKDAVLTWVTASTNLDLSTPYAAANRGGVLKAAFDWANTLKNPKTLGRYITEDYAFCRYARMAGFKVFVYLDAAVGHLGSHMYTGAIKHYFKSDPAPLKKEST